jgi:phytoene synthase
MSRLREAQLQAAYRYCRTLNARHGKTFYLATTLLPRAKRPHVHALYGFARYADDLVDHPKPGLPAADRLRALGSDVRRALDGGDTDNPVVRALSDTVRRFDVDRAYISDFLESMTADLTVTRYATFDDLRRYMWGSASVIGLQILPILGVDGDASRAENAAAELGVAFQLTNFIRDIGEDYRRGRVYLPMESLRAHGVEPTQFSESTTSPEVKRLVAAEVARARDCYRRAEPGIAELAETSQDCVRTAFVLYSDILTEITRMDCAVLERRAVVPLRRRMQVGTFGYLRAVRARRAAGEVPR